MTPSEDHDDSPKALPGEGTPEGDALREAQAAFDRGDFQRVRALTTQLAGASDPEVVAAAAGLAPAVRADPVAVSVLLACLIGFCVVAYHYLSS